MRDQATRMTTEKRLESIEARLDKGSARMQSIEEKQTEMHKELRRNTAATERGNSVTDEIRELLELGKAGFRVLGWIGAAVKWLAPVAAAVVGLWHLFHAGQAPK